MLAPVIVTLLRTCRRSFSRHTTTMMGLPELLHPERVDVRSDKCPKIESARVRFYRRLEFTGAELVAREWRIIAKEARELIADRDPFFNGCPLRPVR